MSAAKQPFAGAACPPLAAYLSLAVCLSLVACRGESPLGYFPLQPGLSWDYHVETVTPQARRENRLRITNLGVSEFDGKNYHVRKTDTGNFYYFDQRHDGIVRVSKRTIIEPYPRANMQERPVFRQPAEVGAQWSYLVKPHLIKRTFETGKILKHEISYLMNWRIEGVDARVEVPAGRFENCLHVRGTATFDVPRVLSSIKDVITFTTDEWYAPGVGLVRVEHSEAVDSDQVDGGSITMALTHFEH